MDTQELQLKEALRLAQMGRDGILRTQIPTLEEIALQMIIAKPARVSFISVEYPNYISLQIEDSLTDPAEIAIGQEGNSFYWHTNSCDFEIAGELFFTEGEAVEIAETLLNDIDEEMQQIEEPEKDSCAVICGACGLFFFLLHDCDLEIEEKLNK